MKSRIDRKNIHISLFTKILIAFILLGLFPLLSVGENLYARLSADVEELMVENAYQMSVNVGKNASEMIRKYDDITKYLYDYTSDDYTWFYELLNDRELAEDERTQQINAVLYNMLNMDRSVENIRFIYDKVYNVSRDSTKTVNVRKALDAQWKAKDDELTSLYLMPTHSEGNYYYHSERKVFTLARNYMDTSTIHTARTRRMGTLYVDIDPQEMKILEEGLHVGGDSRIFVADGDSGALVYAQDMSDVTEKEREIGRILEYMEGESGVFGTDDKIYAYCCIEQTPWKVIVSVDRSGMREMYLDSSRFIIGMMTAAVVILIVFYCVTRYLMRPVRTLAEGMGRIQEGKMDTRVHIKSHDEIQDLGDRFNEMADNLQKYIDKVYIAELRQKDAELSALKSTIRPHYLYNTLEVIRMTAISEQADKASDLIESLSRQLQYLIGNESEQVTLEEELENIREYFYIVRVRYENLYDLEIHVPPECLRLKVLKLILQPIVENAVKHGLRPKKEEGTIQISASREEDCLLLTVMDDGVGMTEQRLSEITERLSAQDDYGQENNESIGMKNTYDRIVKNYGAEYGFQITSCEGVGTIVEYRLPVLEGEPC